MFARSVSQPCLPGLLGPGEHDEGRQDDEPRCAGRRLSPEGAGDDRYVEEGREGERLESVDGSLHGRIGAARGR